VTNVTTATDVSAGAAGTCAIIAGGSVHCWDFGGTAPATVIGF